MCRRPRDVPTAKCRGRRHRSPRRPATELTVGIGRPSAHCMLHRRSPSAQPWPSPQKYSARRSPSAQIHPSAHALVGGPSRYAVTAPSMLCRRWPTAQPRPSAQSLTTGSLLLLCRRWPTAQPRPSAQPIIFI